MDDLGAGTMTTEELQRPRFAWVNAALAAFVVALPCAARLTLMLEKQAGVAPSDLQGVAADLGASLIACALILLAGRRSRALGAPLVGLWVLVNAAIYEFVRVFEAVDAWGHLRYLWDPTFFQGSVATLTHPVAVACALALGVTLAGWPDKGRPGGRRIVATLAVGLALGGVATLWPARDEVAPWRQRNLLLANLIPWPEVEEPNLDVAAVGALDPRDAAIFKADLGGVLRAPSVRTPRNVLLVLLEGVSGAYLPSLASRQGIDYDVQMTRLDAIAREHLSFSTFIAHQRQTNRGEFSILCGDYPRLNASQARMSQIVNDNNDMRCLPEVLGEVGVESVYLQAAPMAFMVKDRFMAHIGFSKSLGDTWFQEGYARNSWGVDDKAFFEQSLGMVKSLQAGDKPWFLTLLTVGTHHPYLVPEGYKPRLPGGRRDAHALALSWLDEGVGAFVEALKAEGVLDDTLVILTSDESAGMDRGADDATRALSQSWSFLIWIAPGGAPGLVAEPFAHSDLAVSILDALSMGERGAHFAGRSVLRDYGAPRPMYFSNVYTRKAYGLDEGVLTTCDLALRGCAASRPAPGRPFGPSRSPVTLDPARRSRMRQVVARTLQVPEPSAAKNKGPQKLLSAPIVELVDLAGSQLVFGGQYLTVPAGSRVEVEIEVEVTGEQGLVELSHDLVTQQGRLHKPTIPKLRGGDAVTITYAVEVAEDRAKLECRLFARKLLGQGLALEFKRATMSIAPSPGPASKTAAAGRKVAVRRGPDPPSTRLTFENPGHFSQARCVRREGTGARALGCARGAVVFGPYAYAPKGSRVRVEVEVEGVGEPVTISGDLVSRRGRRSHARQPDLRVEPGRRSTFALEMSADRAIDDLEARLHLVDARGSLRIHRILLEITSADP